MNQRVIAFVPVRGWSKSIPLKNIKQFCGHPLVYWSLLALENSKYVDEVYVSTDSDAIAEIVAQLHFNKVKVYRRSEENAQDCSSTESAMLEFIKKKSISDSSAFLLVQATSPFTGSEDIDSGIETFFKSHYDSVLSVVPFKRFIWRNGGCPVNYDYKNRPRRQDFEETYLENGAFYINTVSNIKRDENRLSGNVGYAIMPEYSAVEIDEESDWQIAELIMKSFNLSYRDVPDSSRIKLFASDVDGVLTDAGMYYSSDGSELKKFNTHDGKGFELLRNAGIKTALITSETTEIVERRAKKLKVDYLVQGKAHGGKLEALKDICEKEGISLSEVAYIGDDINCYEVLSAVGVAACPSSALDKVKEVPNIIRLSRAEGAGVVREYIELLFSQGKFHHLSK